jgi:hypothetical protein
MRRSSWRAMRHLTQSHPPTTSRGCIPSLSTTPPRFKNHPRVQPSKNKSPDETLRATTNGLMMEYSEASPGLVQREPATAALLTDDDEEFAFHIDHDALIACSAIQIPDQNIDSDHK